MSRRSDFLQMIRRVSQTLPTKATIYRLYGNYADVRFGSSPSIVRNVEILGNSLALSKGDVVLVYWHKQPGRYGKTPVILATEEPTSLDMSGFPPTDGDTIVYGEHGLEVPRGGIGLRQLDFIPSLVGHTHSDPLQKFGWHITNDGILFVKNTFIHPNGQISLGTDQNVIKLDSVHATHRLWVGNLDPAQAPFSVQKDGSIKATAGSIAGWDISANQLSKNNAVLSPSGYLLLGSGDEIVRMDSQHATHRLWAGDADPAEAPFSVQKDGSLKATAGLIAGWDIYDDHFLQGNMKIDAAGRIEAGTGSDIAILDASNPDDWRFWIGAANPDDAPFRVKKTGEAWLAAAHILGDLESDNFVSGQTGWHLDQTGWAEFQDVRIRGTLSSVVYAQETVSVMSGRNIISEGTSLVEDLDDTATVIKVANASFVTYHIVTMQSGLNNVEWLRIMSEARTVAGGYEYDVERGLNGAAKTFTAGEPVIGTGIATYPEEPEPIGGSGFPFGEYPFGGSPFTAMGGFLTLEGESEYGPYFGVAVRHGAVWNQVVDVARFGRLRSFLGVNDGHGVGIGDANRYFRYTYESGLEIKTGYGRTVINDSGFSTERFVLKDAPANQEYVDQGVRLFADVNERKIIAKVKDGAFEQEATLFDFANQGGDDGAGVVFSLLEPENPAPGMIWVEA